MKNPNIKLTINCGKTTDKLKIPMKNPILFLSTFSDIIAKGRLTTAAHPTPNIAINTYKEIGVLPNSTIPKYPSAITATHKACVFTLPNFSVIGSRTNAGSKAPIAFKIRNEIAII